FYSRITYENSPLNRLLKTCDPGNNWAGYNEIFDGQLTEEPGIGVEQNYRLNYFGDSIRRWTIALDTLAYTAADTARNIPISTSTYGSGQLHITTTRDEDGNFTYEYFDSEGRIILKRQLGYSSLLDTVENYEQVNYISTYYVYDDFGRLRMVISPKATSWLYLRNWNFSASG